MKKFDEFRFDGLNLRQSTNKYMTMDRVSADNKKIVVKVDDSHLIATKYGYALILDCETVVFIKDWQVAQNYFGNEVLLQSEFWNAKKWGNHSNFSVNEDNYNFESWLKVAQEQEKNNNKVKW